ncbi:MAG: RidA family protein [Anaerolineae bacterium]|nr:RidA family protein [Anaerolineae bacterium]
MKTGIATVQAPKALGPYSQGISTGQLVFTSGQLGLIPETGVLAGPDVESQARQVMKNIQAVLEAAGTDFAHVVKTTIFLTDMVNFKAVNAIYGEYFPDTPPARSTVAVAALPLGGLVEIETIALLP